MLHRFEARLVDVDRTEPGCGVLLTEADRAHLWRREHGSGNHVVDDRHLAATEQCVGKCVPFSHGGRCQHHPSGHVADGVHASYRGLRPLVHDDCAMGGGHADLFEAQTLCIGHPASGAQDRIDDWRAAVRQLRLQAAVDPASDARHRAAGQDGHAGLEQGLLQMIAQATVKAAQHGAAAHDQHDLRPEALQQAAQFERDVSGALNQHARRLRGPVEELI